MLKFEPNIAKQAMANINKAKKSLSGAKGKKGSVPSDYSLAGDLSAIYSGIDADIGYLDKSNSAIGANVQKNNKAENENQILIDEITRGANFVGFLAEAGMSDAPRTAPRTHLQTRNPYTITDLNPGGGKLKWDKYNAKQQQLRNDYSEVIQSLYWTGKLSDTTSDREIINVLGISRPNSGYGSESDEKKRISCGQELFTNLNTNVFTSAMAYSMAGEAWQYAVRKFVDTNGAQPLPTAIVHYDDIVYQNATSGFSPLSLGDVPGANTSDDPSKSSQTYLDTTSACINGAIAAERDQLFIRSTQPDGNSHVDERSTNLLPVYNRLSEMSPEELANCGLTTRPGVQVTDVSHSNQGTFEVKGYVRSDNVYIITYRNTATGEEYSVRHEICEVDSTHTNLNNGSQTRGDEPLYATEMGLVWLQNRKDAYDELHYVN